MKYRLRLHTKILLGLVVLGLVLVLSAVIAGFIMSEPRPRGTPGPKAEALARKIEGAAGVEAFRALEAVRWDFDGRQQHLWDKRRHLARVKKGGLEVLINLNDQRGRAFEDGKELTGEAQKEALDKAYSWWCNDSFWLNPLAKLFDHGTTRSLVQQDGQEALLIEYSGGGVTPGDAYLWILEGGDAGLPSAWRMWVKIIPIGGLRVSWEGWESFEGAKLSTLHKGLFTLRLKDIKAGALSAVEPGPDPFAKLFERASSGPASQPAKPL